MRPDVSDVLKVGDLITLSAGLFAGLDGEVVEVVHDANPWVGRARLRLPGAGDDYWHPFWSDPMDETEWLAMRNTSGMERFLDKRDPPWRRQRQLYACACVRRVWEVLPEAGRALVERAEDEADENPPLAGPSPLGQRRPWHTGAGRPPLRAEAAKNAAKLLFARQPYSQHQRVPIPLNEVRRLTWLASPHFDEPDHQRVLLRCVAGNPFRPAHLSPDLLAWQHALIPSLARQIYDERRFDETPILADALEDAGCRDERILSHARSPLHARGCWLIDLIRGIS